MKDHRRRRAAALALLLVLCCSLLAGCGEAAETEPFRLEQNEGRDAVSYPYLVRTEGAVWYLSKADMELLGEEAYMEGFRAIVANQKADFADAQAALRGFLNEEIPPVVIHTDFCGKAEESRFGGGYCYGDERGIRLFTNWDAAGTALLHEYVHYLSFCCAETPVSQGFWAEALADYVSKFVCENRMARAVNYGMGDEELQFYLSHGAADPETGAFDIRRCCYGAAEMMNDEAVIGQRYLAVSNNYMVLTAQRREHPTSTALSYYEAACMMEWLVENYGRETVYSHWTIDESEMPAVYGKSFAELYGDWRQYNSERCTELGLVFEP